MVLITWVILMVFALLANRVLELVVREFNIPQGVQSIIRGLGLGYILMAAFAITMTGVSDMVRLMIVALSRDSQETRNDSHDT